MRGGGGGGGGVIEHHRNFNASLFLIDSSWGSKNIVSSEFFILNPKTCANAFHARADPFSERRSPRSEASLARGPLLCAGIEKGYSITRVELYITL